MAPQPGQVCLDDAEVRLVLDALDAFEYWQVGADLPRHEGIVWLPGDAVDDADRFWDGRLPSVEEQEAIAEARLVRALADRLRTQLGGD
jgi:hypothetical protein